MAVRLPKSTRNALLIGFRAGGAGLLFGVAGIHLNLYLTGYKHIATIGWLFLVQIIVAFLIGLSIIIFRTRLASAAGALFAIGTLIVYAVFRHWTIFGFREVRTTAGLTAGLLEAFAFIVLGFATIEAPIPAPEPPPPGEELIDRVTGGARGIFRGAVAVIGALAIIGIVLIAPPKSSTTTASNGGAGAGITIDIQNFAFHPANFTVTPGEKIAVKNEDSVIHNFVPLPGSHPLGAFNSGSINPGQTVTITAPTAAGTYKYECSIHGFTGVMTVS